MREFFSISVVALLVHAVIGVPFWYSIPNFSHGDFSILTAQKEIVYTNIPTVAEFTAKKDAYDSLVLVGDVLLARNIEHLMNTKGETYPFEGVVFSSLSKKPAVVGNFESAIPEKHIPTEPFQMNFSVDAALLPALYSAGFTHFSLANNHSYDSGAHGFAHTEHALFENGFVTFGHPKKITGASVRYVDIGGKRITLIGLNGLNKISESALTRLFSTVSRKSDFQIAFVHWGVEYDLLSNNAQQALAAHLVDLGADLIVGHHPHVTQEVEVINEVPVFYSLGNYIFDQYDDSSTQEGLVLQIFFEPTPTVSILPISSVAKKSQPQFMEENDHQQFLVNLAARSDKLLRKQIISGVLPLQKIVATSTKMAMISL